MSKISLSFSSFFSFDFYSMYIHIYIWVQNQYYSRNFKFAIVLIFTITFSLLNYALINNLQNAHLNHKRNKFNYFFTTFIIYTNSFCYFSYLNFFVTYIIKSLQCLFALCPYNRWQLAYYEKTVMVNTTTSAWGNRLRS